MAELSNYFSALGWPQLIGVAGFLCYFLSFGAVQFRRLDGNGTLYCLANILAAILVSISLTAEFNLASAMIQGSWITAGLIGLIIRARATKRAGAHRNRHSVPHTTQQKEPV
jgi:hypothetical protein